MKRFFAKMDYDSLLKRDLLPGKEFDKLFPPSTCQVQYLGEGLTDHTIEQMEAWILENEYEAEEVANYLKQSSLSGSCKKIHWFLFNHFQYKADQADQYLRAPGCAWYSRYEGMDCKSYSVLASCLLLNMGITHYIRKIKQLGENPEDFTHVYVVVPKNQKTGNLNDGYITIDGTLSTMTEPHFIDKSDLIMSLQHYGLKGAYPGSAEPGLNGLNLNNITSWFSGLFCGDSNSAYKSASLTRNIELMNATFNGLTSEINAAKASKNYNELAMLIAEFIATAKLINQTFTQKKASKNWNDCTDTNFDGTIKASTYFLTAATALQGWRDMYFTKGSVISQVTVTNEGWENLPDWWGMGLIPWIVITEPAQALTEKQNAPNFELTQYIVEATDAKNFDLTKFLQTLANVSQAVSPNPNNGIPSTGTGTYTPGDFNYTEPTNTTQTAGGGLLTWILLLGGLGYAFTQMKDNGKAAKKE